MKFRQFDNKHVAQAFIGTCCWWPFWAISWAIVHSLGFSGWFWRPMILSTCLTDMTKNSFFCVYGRFCGLLPTVLGLWGEGRIYMAHDTQYMFERHDQKLVIFTFFGRFCEL
jgi:hypothetical protein